MLPDLSSTPSTVVSPSTTTIHVAEKLPQIAVMIEVPSPTAVTTPPSTVATLSLEETQHLLKYGGHNELYVKVKRDAYVMFALEKCYDIQKLNELLFECGEKTFE